MAKKLTKTLEKKLKERLERERDHVGRQIKDLRAGDPFANPDHASDNAAIDTDVREKMGHETIEAQVNSLSRKLTWIKRALAKISRHTYGTCERCKKPIAVARLKLIPESRYCVSCERKLIK